MKNFWKWILGITLVLVLFFGPYLFQLAFPTLGFGYGMMVGRADHFGMMGGRGFSFFGAGLMWLVPLGTLALIVLGGGLVGEQNQNLRPGIDNIGL